MPLEEAAADALAERIIRPAWFGFLDFLGDPVRATTWKRSVTFAGTGDADLDGETFSAVSHELVEVGEIRQGEGGSSTVPVRLSGLIGVDTDLLNTIGDPTNYAGRVFRLWLAVYGADGVRLGAVAPFYTGYMTRIRITGSPSEQVIEVSAENYLAALSRASGRTYMDQADFDPGDLSAKAALEAANGVSGNAITNNAYAGGAPRDTRTIPPGLVSRF